MVRFFRVRLNEKEKRLLAGLVSFKGNREAVGDLLFAGTKKDFRVACSLARKLAACASKHDVTKAPSPRSYHSGTVFVDDEEMGLVG